MDLGLNRLGNSILFKQFSLNNFREKVLSTRKLFYRFLICALNLVQPAIKLSYYRKLKEKRKREQEANVMRKEKEKEENK